MNIRIAFFDAKPYDIESFTARNTSFKYEIKFFKEHLNPDTAKLTAGYNVVCAFVNDILSKPVINVLEGNGVKLIALRCAGYNNVDLAAAYGKLHVVRVPAYSPYAVAEHALALMLTLDRKTHKAYTRTRDNNFNINGLLGFDMRGKTIGVIGTGKIGQVLINLLKGFEMKVLAYDLFPNKAVAEQLGFTYVDLPTLYRESDIISLHCPLTKESTHMIDARSIAQMKDGVMLINTSRGELINTKDLIEGLKSKKIGYAGLDVYEEESDYFFEDFSGLNITDDVLARLLTFNNVLVTSHQAFFTAEALHNIADTTLGNIKEFYAGAKMPNEVCYQCNELGTAKPCRKKSGGKCF
jgi:D-lactate dehydrogenase